MKEILCKICDRQGHYAYQCFRKKREPLKTTRKLKSAGKHYRKWQATKRQWFQMHVADYYTCYICNKLLRPGEVTLDHIKPRGSHPQLRYEMTNLMPCCYVCNQQKGSKSAEKVLHLR